MVQGRGGHADEDKKLRESIEARNEADSLIYSLEKAHQGQRGKIEDPEKQAIESEIAGLRKADGRRRRGRHSRGKIETRSRPRTSSPSASTGSPRSSSKPTAVPSRTPVRNRPGVKTRGAARARPTIMLLTRTTKSWMTIRNNARSLEEAGGVTPASGGYAETGCITVRGLLATKRDYYESWVCRKIPQRTR